MKLNNIKSLNDIFNEYMADEKNINIFYQKLDLLKIPKDKIEEYLIISYIDVATSYKKDSHEEYPFDNFDELATFFLDIIWSIENV